MKQLARAALVAAFMFVPLGAFADSSPPPPPGGPGAGPMGQVRSQIDQVRAQARSAALNALTPTSRTLLSQVVGQLAVANTPDVNAAAKQLDAELSPREAKAILDAQNNLETQTQAIIDKARAAAGDSAGPDANRPRPPGSDDQTQNDAGLALLRLAVQPMGPPRFIRMSN
jgi:hypothetical protein